MNFNDSFHKVSRSTSPASPRANVKTSKVKKVMSSASIKMPPSQQVKSRQVSVDDYICRTMDP